MTNAIREVKMMKRVRDWSFCPPPSLCISDRFAYIHVQTIAEQSFSRHLKYMCGVRNVTMVVLSDRIYFITIGKSKKMMYICSIEYEKANHKAKLFAVPCYLSFTSNQSFGFCAIY